MKLVVGLGNPGLQYEKTRHNVGFMVVDEIARQIEHTPWKNQFKGEICSFTLNDEKVYLLKPQTFMNLSGESVGEAALFYKILPEDIFCIYDDMDLPTGKIRIRLNGSSGGHNGIKSMISHLGTDNFIRFRLGIGRPLPSWTVVDHVLAKFNESEQEDIAKGINDMAKAVLGTLKLGVEKGMNRFNPRKGR